MGSTKSVLALELDPGPTASGPVYFPTTVPCLQRPCSVLCRFPSCQSGVSDLPLAWVSCFCGFPHHGLDPSVCMITSPSLQMELSPVVSLDLCICFHLFLEEGSSFSGDVDCRMVIFCFISGTTHESVHIIFVFLGLGYFTQDFFF